MEHPGSCSANGPTCPCRPAITAEILALPRFGVGRQMQNTKYYLDVPELFAWTFLVIILSVIIESLVKYLLKKAGKRYD